MITYITLLDRSVKVNILISNTVFQSANSTCYYVFTPPNFIPIQNFIFIPPALSPQNKKPWNVFISDAAVFVLRKANDAHFLNMYKQKNLTDFKLLVERHSKQKWKKFTVSENWISLKTKMIDFQKKKNKVQRFRLWYTCIWYSYTKFTNTEWDSTDQVLKLCIKSAI